MQLLLTWMRLDERFAGPVPALAVAECLNGGLLAQGMRVLDRFDH